MRFVAVLLTLRMIPLLARVLLRGAIRALDPRVSVEGRVVRVIRVRVYLVTVVTITVLVKELHTSGTEDELSILARVLL